MDPDQIVEEYHRHGLTTNVQQAIQDYPNDFIDYMDEGEQLAELVAENL